MSSIALKRCHICGNHHPATREFFFTDPRSTDGFRNPCKPCRGVISRPEYKPLTWVIIQGVARVAFPHDYVVLIDECDIDLLSHRWYIHSGGHSNNYICRSNPRGVKPKCIYLHREILVRIIGRSIMGSEYTDHINGNRMDNRRANLRIATRGQNQRNVKIHKDNASGLKGAYFSKTKGKFASRIMVAGVTHSLGYFDTAIEAHEAYCKAAAALHGEFARFR
jgi:hypothetical protein